MACSCAGKRKLTARSVAGGATAPAVTRQAAAQAAVDSSYEVLTAAGKPAGRTFTSLVSASAYARRIGGTTRPAR